MVKVSPVRYFLPASCVLIQSNFFLRFAERVFLHRRIVGRIEQRREALVHFAGDEVEPFLHAITLERAVLRREVRLGLLVGEVLHDRHAFGEHLAVVELERGTEPLELMAR